eukprot:361612-Chlamydomonas_euryale.AAC.12
MNGKASVKSEVCVCPILVCDPVAEVCSRPGYGACNDCDMAAENREVIASGKPSVKSKESVCAAVESLWRWLTGCSKHKNNCSTYTSDCAHLACARCGALHHTAPARPGRRRANMPPAHFVSTLFLVL